MSCALLVQRGLLVVAVLGLAALAAVTFLDRPAFLGPKHRTRKQKHHHHNHDGRNNHQFEHDNGDDSDGYIGLRCACAKSPLNTNQNPSGGCWPAGVPLLPTVIDTSARPSNETARPRGESTSLLHFKFLQQPPLPPQLEVVARRRAALFSDSVHPSVEVQRVVSRKELIEHYVCRGEPVVLSGCFDASEAVSADGNNMDALDVIVEGYAQAEAEAEEAAAKAKAEAAAKGKAGQEHGDAADDDAMCGNSRYKGSVADTLNPRGLMDGLRMRDFTTDTLWKTVASVPHFVRSYMRNATAKNLHAGWELVLPLHRDHQSACSGRMPKTLWQRFKAHNMWRCTLLRASGVAGIHLGVNGSIVPTHFDYPAPGASVLHAIGSKRWELYPTLDWAHAPAIVTVHAGEVLFVPHSWYHGNVCTSEVCASLALEAHLH